MIQLNLLPDVKKEYIHAERMKTKVIGIAIMVTLGAAGLSIVLASIVYAVQPGLIGLKTKDIKSKSEQLRSVEDIEKYLTIQNQLRVLPELHNDKALYSQLLDYLKVLNPAPPNNVRLTSLQVDYENKSIFFNGTTNGFEAFTVFQDTLRNAELTYKGADGSESKGKLFADRGVRIQNQALSNALGKQELIFSIEAKYSDIAFNPMYTSTKVTVPNIKTTQSITGTPGRASAPLFDDRGGVDAQNNGGIQ